MGKTETDPCLRSTSKGQEATVEVLTHEILVSARNKRFTVMVVYYWKKLLRVDVEPPSFSPKVQTRP